MPKGGSGKSSSGGGIQKAQITEGSEKQIAWAKDIQSGWHDNIQDEKAKLSETFEKQFATGAQLQGGITKSDVTAAINETATRIARETLSSNNARTYINDDMSLAIKTGSVNFGKVFSSIIAEKMKS